MRRFTTLILSLVIAWTGLAVPGAAAPGQGETLVVTAHTGVEGVCLDEEEAAFVQLINDYRAQNGKSRLVATRTLTAAAKHHSTSMATHDYFSHDLVPEGIGWSQNMTNHGYTYNTWRGENIAAGRSTAQGNFDMWRNSPGHNGNMLSDNYRAIGIGRARTETSYYKWYWTNTFGGHVDAEVHPCGTGDPGGDGGDGGDSSGQAAVVRIVGGSRSANSTTAARVYDGDPGTAWRSTSKRAPDRAYVIVDLGRVEAVGTIEWMFSEIGHADEMRIAVSRNERNWTRIAQPGNAAAADTWQSLAYGGSARYVRFAFPNPDKDAVVGFLSEVRVLR